MVLLQVKLLVSTVNGSSVAEKVRNLLGRLLSDDLMISLNYHGRGLKNKKGLVDFKMVLSLIFGMYCQLFYFCLNYYGRGVSKRKHAGASLRIFWCVRGDRIVSMQTQTTYS